MKHTCTLNCDEYEYTSEPTDGVTLGDGQAWWGSHIRYRKVGARRWQTFTLIDVHSWDTDAIIAAIDYTANP